MKGLTLTEPWASLMAKEAKKLETRSWSTKYRGPVAIHSAKGFPNDAKWLCWEKPFSLHVWESDCSAQRGKIIAVGFLYDVTPTRAEYDAEFLRSEEYAFGDYSPRRFIWSFRDMKKLSVPIPFTGKLGLWNVSEGLQALIEDRAKVETA